MPWQNTGLRCGPFSDEFRMIAEVVKEYVSNECRSDRNVLGPGFFDQHVSVVVEYSRAHAKSLGADLEIVELAAWLHDIAAVQDIAALPRHPALGAEIAQNLLEQNGYPSERIERVTRCILFHSVPVQIGGGAPEEVCVSNADAMSLIVKPAWWFYFLFRVRELGFEEGKAWLLRRVECNWAALIQPARDLIEVQCRQTRELLKA